MIIRRFLSVPAVCNGEVAEHTNVAILGGTAVFVPWGAAVVHEVAKFLERGDSPVATAFFTDPRFLYTILMAGKQGRIENQVAKSSFPSNLWVAALRTGLSSIAKFGQGVGSYIAAIKMLIPYTDGAFSSQYPCAETGKALSRKFMLEACKIALKALFAEIRPSDATTADSTTAHHATAGFRQSIYREINILTILVKILVDEVADGTGGVHAADFDPRDAGWGVCHLHAPAGSGKEGVADLLSTILLAIDRVFSPSEMTNRSVPAFSRERTLEEVGIN